MYKPANDLPVWFFLGTKRVALNGPITLKRTPPKLNETVPNATQEEMKQLYQSGSPLVIKVQDELQSDKPGTGSTQRSEGVKSTPKEV